MIDPAYSAPGLLQLPLEVRITIYANCGFWWGFIGLEEIWKDHNKKAMQSPAIYHRCRQLRDENLPLYYRRNYYTIGVLSESDLWAIVAWLERSGGAATNNIRNMSLLVPYIVYTNKKALQRIHAALSDDATVRYHWGMQALLHLREWFMWLMDKDLTPGDRPNIQQVLGGYILTFPLGQGWFGPQCRAKACKL